MGRDLSSILRVCFVCTRHAGDQLAQGDFNRTERNVIRSDCCQYSVASSAMFRHSSLCRFIVLAVVTVVVAAVNSGSGSKVEILPACKCTWPEIGAEGAEEQQLCPPLHVKCDMCMNGVHAIRFGNHPRSVCGLFRQDEENVGFCNTMGDEMFERRKEVKAFIVESTHDNGPGYGTSQEKCILLGCCSKKNQKLLQNRKL